MTRPLGALNKPKTKDDFPQPSTKAKEHHFTPGNTYLITNGHSLHKNANPALGIFPLTYVKKSGIHHVFSCANWIQTYTDAQLIGNRIKEL